MSEPDPEPKIGDLLGVKQFGKAANTLAEGTVTEAHNFLEKICYPAAKELGLLLKDQVKAWRASNATRIAAKAAEKVKVANGDAQVHASPRLVGQIMETGSWTDESDVQDMWAGLLASSCHHDGNDDSNLIFINLMSQLTGSEARLLRSVFAQTRKVVDQTNNTLALHAAQSDRDRFIEEAGYGAVGEEERRYRLAIEFRHLQSLELVEGGPSPHGFVSISLLGLDLWVRCMGSRKPPLEYVTANPDDQTIICRS